jgi:hypothetical protein
VTNEFCEFRATGFNWFLKLNFNRIYGGATLETTPPTVPFNGNVFDVEATPTSDDGRILVEWGYPNAPIYDAWIRVDVSSAMPNEHRVADAGEWRVYEYVTSNWMQKEVTGLVPNAWYWIRVAFIQNDGRQGLWVMVHCKASGEDEELTLGDYVVETGGASGEIDASWTYPAKAGAGYYVVVQKEGPHVSSSDPPDPENWSMVNMNSYPDADVTASGLTMVMWYWIRARCFKPGESPGPWSVGQAQAAGESVPPMASFDLSPGAMTDELDWDWAWPVGAGAGDICRCVLDGPHDNESDPPSDPDPGAWVLVREAAWPETEWTLGGLLGWKWYYGAVRYEPAGGGESSWLQDHACPS